MRTGQATALLFRLMMDSSQPSRELRRFGVDYRKEVRALETAGQRVLTVLSAPVRGRLGLPGSLAISAARQALRNFAESEVALATAAQKQAAAAGQKLEAATAGVAAATALATNKGVRHLKTLADQAQAFKFTRREVELFADALARADRVDAGRAALELRGTFKRLGVNRVTGRRDPETALSQFSQAFNRIESAEDRAALAAEVFGRSVGRMLPRLEAARSALLGTEAAATGAAGGIMRTAGAAAGVAVPVGLAVVALIALTAAYVGLAAVGIKAGKAAGEVGEAIYRASERTGIGAEKLSVYRVAAEQANVSFDTFGLGITRFRQRLVEAAEGNDKLRDTFRRLGIDAREGAREPEKAFDTFVKNFSRAEEGAKKTQVAITLFGESGAKMIPVVNRLGREYEAIKEQALALGQVLTDAEAKALHDTHVAFKELKAAGGGLALTLGKEAAPAVTLLIRTLANLIKEGKPVAAFIGRLSAGVIADLTLRILRTVAAITTIPAAVRETVEAMATGQAALGGYAMAAYEAGKAIYAASTYDMVGAMQSAMKAKEIAANITAFTADRLKRGVANVTTTYEETLKRLTAKAPDVPQAGEDDLGTREPRDREGERRRKEREESLRRARQQRLENEVADAALAYKTETEALERQYEERLISLSEFVEKSIAAEDKLLKAREANFRAAIEEARRVARERRMTEEELQAHIGDIEIRAKEARQERAAKEAELLRRRFAAAEETARAERENQDEINELHRRANNIRSGLRDTNERREQRAITAERRAFEDRRRRLDAELTLAGRNVERQAEVTREIMKLGAERQVFEAEAGVRMHNARQQDLEDLARYQDELRDIYDRIKEIERRSEEGRLEEFERASRDRVGIIQRRAALALKFAEADMNARVEELERERDRRVALELDGSKRLQITEAYDRLIEAELMRHLEEKDRIRREKKRDLERADPRSGRSLFGDEFAEARDQGMSALGSIAVTASSVLGELSAQAGNFKSFMVEAFGAVGDAVGHAARSYVLFGTAGTSLRKFAAETIASVVQMSAVKALFEAAEAAAMYALFYFTGSAKFLKSAKEHGLAALLYGGVALTGAGIGRVVAGNAFREGAGAGSAAGGAFASGGSASFDRDRDTYSRDSRGRGEGGSYWERTVARLMERSNQALEANAAALNRNSRAVEGLEAVPEDHIVRRTLQREPEIAADAAVSAINSNPVEYGRKLAPALGVAS